MTRLPYLDRSTARSLEHAKRERQIAVQDEQLGPVYVARVAVETPAAELHQSGITITPGMAATAEITTDERRVIDYLLSPIERRVDEAGRER